MKQCAADLQKSSLLQVEDIRMAMLESKATLANLAKLIGHGGGRMLLETNIPPMHARTFIVLSNRLSASSHH